MDVLKTYYDSIYDDLMKLDKHTIAAASAIFLSGAITVYAAQIYSSFQFFKRQGIKTPKFSYIFGNLKELKRNQSEVIKEWTKKYGKTFGLYQGHLPVLVTSDMDIIQEVFIKQFNNFSARKQFPLETDDNDGYKNLIRSVKGRWKRMRIIMNPTFSSSKLKEMGPLIIKCTDRLVEQLDENDSVEINISEYMKRFTMDTIWNCAFGMDIDMQNDKDNLYFINSEGIFRQSAYPNFFQMASALFPELNSILRPLDYLIDRIRTLIFRKPSIPRIWLNKEIGQLLERRKIEKISKRDYMQLLLDAESTKMNYSSTDQMDLNDLIDVRIDKTLSRDEIKSNLAMFMLAGYETTSTALQYCCYVLATHQEEQQKLRDEIDTFYSDESITPNTANVKEITYLDSFIKEVTRIYPIARLVRRCVHGTTIKGVYIKPGMLVTADHITIHYDPELWGPTDPYVFDPTRHETKRNPLAHLAFGAGPRNCIGMKFAIVEMKVALVNLIRKFEILPSEKTPKKLELIEGIVRSPKHGVPVIFKKRH